MSTQNIQFHDQNVKISQNICFLELPKGLKNEFQLAVVNEPSVFVPLRFYCIYHYKLYFNITQ